MLQLSSIMNKLVISFALLIGFIVTVPYKALSQKTLKLDLQKGIEKENQSLRSSGKAAQKLVRRMDFYEEGEHKTMSMYFEYDAQGRVVKTINKGYYYRNFFENAEVLYNVNGKTLTVKSSPVNRLTKSEVGESAVCELNEMGYVEEATCMDAEGFTQDFSLVYDENGYPLTYDDAGSWGIYAEYSWVDGNLDKANIKEGNRNTVYEYIYTAYENKANLDFNRMFVQSFGEWNLQMDFLGYFGKKDKKLLRGVDNVTFEYTFDEDGYVTKIKSSDDAVCTAEVFYDEGTVPDPNPDPDPDPTPSNPTTEEELEGAIDNAPEGSEDSPTEIFIPSDGITLEKPLDINKHIRLKGGKLIRSNDNPYAMLRIRSGYSLELEDITIDGNVLRQKDGTLIVYGKLKLKDGVSIKNCYRSEADSPSGAICVARGGVLTMNGGTISGNTGAYGSAVYNEGTFTMTDGEISANSGQIGTVVNNAGGEFIMTGGRISSNKVTDGCGGVFVSDNCTFTMTGGEISGNEDCDLYTWSDLQIGGSAKVSGLTLLNDGNRLLVNPALRNNWQISYVDTPPAGTIVATGRSGYRLAATDLQKIIYYNNVCQLKLSDNNIVTYQTGTGVDEINAVSFHLSVSDNRIQVEGLPVRTPFTIYGIDGRAVSTHTTDNSGQCSFFLESGIYLLNYKDQTKKFLVK